jgi:gliding motility-associated-like protein
MFIKAQHIIITITLCCAITFTKAQQNLVLNPGLEDTLFCSFTSTVTQFSNWYNPTLNSSWGNHYCVYQIATAPKPRTGYGCIYHFSYYPSVTNSASYAGGELSQRLIKNKTYCVNFYFRNVLDPNPLATNPWGSKYGTNNVCVYLDTVKFYNPTFYIYPKAANDSLSYTILDSVWHKYTYLHTAQDNEKFFMLGQCRTYENADYPLLFSTAQTNGNMVVYDDFSIMPVDIDLGNDTNMCVESDSLLIGESNWTETSYKWFANGILIDTLHGQIKIKPNSNTTYVVQKQTSCITTSDTLVVTYTGTCPVLPTDITEPIIPNVFTPNGDDINEYWRITLPTAAKLLDLEVYNRWGNIVFASEGTIKPWFGRTSSGEPCSEGVYFYVLKYTDAKGEEQSKNGYVSLFR